MFGFFGCYLRVDVTDGSVERVPLDEAVLRKYLGGAGLGARLLLDQPSATLDPLSPEAPLAFAFSPLVASPLTTSAKFAVICKSPLTDRFNDSLSSSGFAIAGKRCGCDAIVIVGRAPRPSLLVIDDGAARLEPADDVLGLSCRDTEDHVRATLTSEFKVASIGPAGERAVRFASLSHDGRHAGRGGSGAVLGSKNIKAIAVHGTQRPAWAHPRMVTDLARNLSRRSLGPATAKYRELGTATNMLTFDRFGTLPTHNFQRGTFADAANLSPAALQVGRQHTRASCVTCTIGCEHMFSLGSSTVRVEYESLFALGSLCGVGNQEAVLRASQRCDDVGIDTISAGGTIAFAMECVERGLLDEPWLRFGSHEALLHAIELIGTRDGIGALLAEGSRRAAFAIGQDSIAFAPQVKGMEIPGYEPRALQTMALGFAVGARGADHNRSGAYEVDFSDRVDRRNATLDSVRYAIETEDRAALMDSLILCKFLRGVFTDFFAESATMLHAITGWHVTADELHDTARGIVAAKREFNIRAGWTAAEDTLPARFLDAPLESTLRPSCRAKRWTRS